MKQNVDSLVGGTSTSHPPRCLVFGGSGALGSAVCRCLHHGGARLAFTYHSSGDRAKALASELPGSIALPLDVLSVPALERLIDQVAADLGGLDTFVQCAGVGVTASSTEAQVHHTVVKV